MAVEEPSQTTNDAHRSQQARARARPPDLTERLNIFAKAVGLGVLIALIGVGAFGRFYDARFNGLVSTTAMEIGDIAQQLRVGHGMSTKVIRPLALAYGQRSPVSISAIVVVSGAWKWRCVNRVV